MSIKDLIEFPHPLTTSLHRRRIQGARDHMHIQSGDPVSRVVRAEYTRDAWIATAVGAKEKRR